MSSAKAALAHAEDKIYTPVGWLELASAANAAREGLGFLPTEISAKPGRDSLWWDCGKWSNSSD